METTLRAERRGARPADRESARSTSIKTHEARTRYILLLFGVLASVFYIGVNVFVPTQYAGYDVMSQTVSELSAIGAPTRQLWTILMIPYGLLMLAFGFGVLFCAPERRALRIVGYLMIANAMIGFLWPPMHPRGAKPTATDTMHIVFTAVSVSIFILEMVVAAVAIRGFFKAFSIFSLLVLIAFGVLTGLDAPGIAADTPTPMIGVWERISIGAYNFWAAVFACTLIFQKHHSQHDSD